MKCDYEYEAWGPHEGCREFMTEPETWPCDEDATVEFTDPWCGETFVLCATHAAEVAADPTGQALTLTRTEIVR